MNPPTHTRPEPLPRPANDIDNGLDFGWKREFREYLDLWLFIGREVWQAFGQIGRALADLYRQARDPRTSHATLIGITRALLQMNVLYGVMLAVVMPLAGAGERAWQIILTMTVVSLAIERMLADEWFGGSFKAKKVSLIKNPRP